MAANYDFFDKRENKHERPKSSGGTDLNHHEIQLVPHQEEEMFSLETGLNRTLAREERYLIQLKSPCMQEVYSKVKSVADTMTTILISGETGTGKGVIARLIHGLSQRKKNPFVSVHCGAIPETLFESELFGHEKGAFTGAFKRRLGKFELAAGGTIFLDEVGTISVSAQTKLLQVLQERRFQRIGGEKDIDQNARIIAATNADLRLLCEQGYFRKDLFYRLNVFPIHIPPLKEHTEDILPLAYHTLHLLEKRYNKGIKSFHFSVEKGLRSYHWPGNIREMENIIERAYILESTSELRPESFPVDIFTNTPAIMSLDVDIDRPLAEVREAVLMDAELAYLKAVLTKYKGRIDKSATHTGLSVRHLNNLMHKHNLDKKMFKSEK